MPSTNIRWADESASTSERVAEFLQRVAIVPHPGNGRPTRPNWDEGGTGTIYKIDKPCPLLPDRYWGSYIRDAHNNIYTNMSTACGSGVLTSYGCHFCKDCGQITPTPGCFNPTGPRRPDMCVCTDSDMVNVRSHQRRKPNTTNQKVEVLVATLTEDPLSNAQQRLEQQKILTDKASTAAKDAEDGRAKARMVLEEAQKTFSDSVKNEEEAKVTETETASVLVALQREVDELVLLLVEKKLRTRSDLSKKHMKPN